MKEQSRVYVVDKSGTEHSIDHLLKSPKQATISQHMENQEWSAAAARIREKSDSHEDLTREDHTDLVKLYALEYARLGSLPREGPPKFVLQDQDRERRSFDTMARSAIEESPYPGLSSTYEELIGDPSKLEDAKKDLLKKYGGRGGNR